MDKGLIGLIIVLGILVILINYIDSKTKQKMAEEITALKYKLECTQKQFEGYKKNVDYRLAFDEKCLYDLLRKSEESAKSVTKEGIKK